jgi:iron complex outermembrane receptor protein
VKSAGDAFGTSVGNERIGLYNDGDARGFSPAAAGNIRMEGLYIDGPPVFSGRLVSGSALRVGIAAQGYPFPRSDRRRRLFAARRRTRRRRERQHDGGSLRHPLAQPRHPAAVPGRALGLAGGMAYGHFEQVPGDIDEQFAVGGVLHWRASDRLLIQPLFAVFDLPSLQSTPQVFT